MGDKILFLKEQAIVLGSETSILDPNRLEHTVQWGLGCLMQLDSVYFLFFKLQTEGLISLLKGQTDLFTLSQGGFVWWCRLYTAQSHLTEGPNHG